MELSSKEPMAYITVVSFFFLWNCRYGDQLEFGMNVFIYFLFFTGASRDFVLQVLNVECGVGRVFHTLFSCRCEIGNEVRVLFFAGPDARNRIC